MTMYRDCQVLPSMVGNGAPASVISPDPLFFGGDSGGADFAGFMAGMPFHAFSSVVVPKVEGMTTMMGLGMEERELESGSGNGHVDGASGGEEQDGEAAAAQLQQKMMDHPNQAPAKKKRCLRHTAFQIQELEALFKACPHPDDKQRTKLSQDLGLKPRQVKFWFQNRRTQMKAQQDRTDNVILREENSSLKSENYQLQAAIGSVVCPSCGGAAMLGEMSFNEQNLRVENARLKEELERLSCIASRLGTPAPAPPILLLPSLDLNMGIYSRNFYDEGPAAAAMVADVELSPFADGPMVMEQEKAVALDLAATAADHVGRMCREGKPLWVRGGDGVEALDLVEHRRLLPWPNDDVKSGRFRVESSRDAAVVIMNSITLVDAFMDSNKWMQLFPSIVSNAKTIQILSPGIIGHCDGALQLMCAEIRFLSPLVSTREAHFLRYCQHNVEESTWTIVDFPIGGGFQEGSEISLPSNYKRRASGCLIQDMPNGYSRVVWVEHVEVKDDKPLHKVFEKYVTSSIAFGATRWLAVLQRQCERLASLMARNISDLGVFQSLEARKNIMELSQRMVRTFCSNISSGSGCPSWTALSEDSDDTIRVSTRKNTDPGQPNGIILTAISTTWLPFSHCHVFDLLTDERRRSQFDVLSNGNSLHEVAHIANGSHPRNCISLLRINATGASTQNVELLLQESSTHPAGGSFVVYATVDVGAVQVAMSGDDPSYVPLLPMGFVLLPAGASPNSIAADGGSSVPSPPSDGGDINGPPGATGCLVTVVLQVLSTALATAKLNVSSVAAIKDHLSNTVNQISAALGDGGFARAEPPSATSEQ